MNAIQAMILDHLLHDPVLQAMILKAVTDLVRTWFKKVDDGNLKNEGWLHPAVLVATFLATALNLLATGHLQDLDLSAVGSLILSYIGAKSVSTKLVQDSVKKIKNELQ